MELKVGDDIYSLIDSPRTIVLNAHRKELQEKFLNIKDIYIYKSMPRVSPIIDQFPDTDVAQVLDLISKERNFKLRMFLQEFIIKSILENSQIVAEDKKAHIFSVMYHNLALE